MKITIKSATIKGSELSINIQYASSLKLNLRGFILFFTHEREHLFVNFS